MSSIGDSELFFSPASQEQQEWARVIWFISGKNNNNFFWPWISFESSPFFLPASFFMPQAAHVPSWKPLFGEPSGQLISEA